MKANPFADQVPQQEKSAPKGRNLGGQGKPNTKNTSAPKRDFKPSKPKPVEKEMSMEEKLALLREKFKK
jgi:hypothetical protein